MAKPKDVGHGVGRLPTTTSSEGAARNPFARPGGPVPQPFQASPLHVPNEPVNNPHPVGTEEHHKLEAQKARNEAAQHTAAGNHAKAREAEDHARLHDLNARDAKSEQLKKGAGEYAKQALAAGHAAESHKGDELSPGELARQAGEKAAQEESSGGGGFDDADHPRDEHGKFTTK